MRASSSPTILRKAYERLPTEAFASDGRYGVERGGPNAYVGSSASGAPVIFIRVTGPALTPRRIRLSNLEIKDEVECVVQEQSGATQSGRFTVVECTSDEPSVREMFFLVLDGTVGQLPEAATTADVRRMWEHLAELFAAQNQPPRFSPAGLWGELFVISRVPQKLIPQALGAWHFQPNGKHDFGLGNDALEVKLSSTGVRQHHFSLEQLSVPAGHSLVVASVVTLPRVNGCTLLELYRYIRNAVQGSPRLSEHLDRIVSQTLGNSLSLGLELAFDRTLAESGLKFYPAHQVPRPPRSEDPRVSRVRFVSDLEGLEADTLGGETRSQLLKLLAR